MTQTPYYAREKAPERLRETDTERKVLPLLPTSAKIAVEEACKRWNQIMRDQVRSVTGLRFGDGKSIFVQVPVEVVDGIPEPFDDHYGTLEPWQWWLLMNLPLLRETAAALKHIGSAERLLSPHVEDAQTGFPSVSTTRTFVEKMAKLAEQQKPPSGEGSDTTTIPVDYLGAYWIRSHRIHIYWQVITVVSARLALEVETVTAIVLCHELVHAYTHVGRDIDQNIWPDAAFMAADLHVTEGLAEYYTERVVDTLDYRLREGRKTFDALSAGSAPCYTSYKKWLDPAPKPTPEMVRFAMLQFRNGDPAPTQQAQFDAMLAGAAGNLRRQRRQEQTKLL